LRSAGGAIIDDATAILGAREAMSDDSQHRIVLGHIVGAHGIRGDVIIRSYTQEPLDIAAYGPLLEENGSRTFKITKARPASKGIVAHLAEIDDRDSAEALTGVGLTVERKKLPQPEPDAYYHADLIGLDVVDPAGVPIGSIVGVHNYGAGDILELKLSGRRDTELVPFTAAYVPDVDIKARRVSVVLPPEDQPDDN
jgi:16S rRNA processing protein RimM